MTELSKAYVRLAYKGDLSTTHETLRMLTSIIEGGGEVPLISLQRLGYSAERVRQCLAPFIQDTTLELSRKPTGNKTKTGLAEMRTMVTFKGERDE